MQRFYGQIRDAFGNVAGSGSVLVIDAGTGLPATIYSPSSNLINPVVTISNPISSDANGRYGFAAPDGQYTIVVTGPDSSVQTMTRVQFFTEDSLDLVHTTGDETIDGVKTFLDPSRFTTGLVIEKTSGIGIMVDNAAPTYPWHDVIGHVMPKTTGAGTPAFVTYNGNIQAFKFVANDICDFLFHIPHDYMMGSDLFWHIHWSHNGTAISGNVVFTHYATYAKGHDQEDFPAEVTNTITYNTTNIATTPQYRHRVDEVQLSTPGGSASMLDTNNIEPDGVILIRMKLTTLPTITAGSLFVHTGDVHFQSTNIGTKQKSPNFWV